MVNSRVTISGLENFAKIQIQSIKLLSSKHIEEMALRTEFTIKAEIAVSITRNGSTGKLENAFFAERISSTSWGVGRIDYLNRVVPYWRWINFGVAGTGRSIPPGTLENDRIVGHFDAPANGRFQKGSPFFPMNPRKAITPHNFIARTLQKQNSIISSVFRTVKV